MLISIFKYETVYLSFCDDRPFDIFHLALVHAVEYELLLNVNIIAGTFLNHKNVKQPVTGTPLICEMESLVGVKENNFKKAITEMKARLSVSRIFKLTPRTEGNKNSR